MLQLGFTWILELGFRLFCLLAYLIDFPKRRKKKVDAINPQLSERRRRGPSSLVKFCYILSKNKKENWQKFLSCSTFSPFCIYLDFPTTPPWEHLIKKLQFRKKIYFAANMAFHFYKSLLYDLNHWKNETSCN